MKYLITGGAGFLGIKLTERLIRNKKNKIIWQKKHILK